MVSFPPYPMFKFFGFSLIALFKERRLRFVREFDGHKAGIECMAISADGLTLLTGDDDALVIVWNLSTGENIQKISCVYHGPISAVVWININDSSEPAFVFGCADGSLHLYKKKPGGAVYDFVSMENFHDGTIESLAFDPVHRRIASVGCGIPQVWKISAAGTMSPVIARIESNLAIARNVFFCDDGASIVVCYLESHEIICFSIEPWGVKWSKTIPTRIGNAFLCSDDGIFIFVSNLSNGVDQYRFPSLEKIQSFPHAIENNYPLQVSTAALGSLIVCGGDNGFARVFNRRTGQLMQRLEHGNCHKEVTIIATCNSTNGAVVVTGESGTGDCKARLWREDIEPTASSSLSSPRLSIMAKLNSSLTAYQVISMGAIVLTCWHSLAVMWSMFLDSRGPYLIGKMVMHIWMFAFSSLVSHLTPATVAEITLSDGASPSTVVVTQTSVQIVTSIMAAAAVNTPSEVAPSITSITSVCIL